MAWYLRTGATLVLLRRWRAEAALRAVIDHRMPALGGISAQVALLLRVPWLGAADLSHLRALVVGGGPSPPALVTEARERFGVAYSARWLRTDDLGSLDEHGRLRLAGRTGDTYFRGGYNVHPETVERVLAGHHAVAEVAVVPRVDPVMGEVGVAVVVPGPRAGELDLDALRTYAAAELAHHELPEALVQVDALPRTPMGKLDRRALRTEVQRSR